MGKHSIEHVSKKHKIMALPIGVMMQISENSMVLVCEFVGWTDLLEHEVHCT